MLYKGFNIEVARWRGKWRVRLRKPRGGMIRTPDDDFEISEWVSTAYMEREYAIEQAKAAIDSGLVS
jgi:hypothetical protein